jgi:hypothetical protein
MTSYITQFTGRLTHHEEAIAELPHKVVRWNKGTRNINRRMVLPLEEGNWMRALEILQPLDYYDNVGNRKRIAKQGVSADHYVSLLKMLDLTSRGKTRGRGTGHRFLLDVVTDGLTDGVIPYNTDLIETVFLGYTRQGFLEEAWSFLQMFSATSIKIPSEVALVTELFEAAAKAGAEDLAGATLKKLPNDVQESIWARQLLAECASLQGDWQEALQLLDRTRAQPGQVVAPDLFARDWHSQTPKSVKEDDTPSRPGTGKPILPPTEIGICLGAAKAGNWQLALETLYKLAPPPWQRTEQSAAAKKEPAIPLSAQARYEGKLLSQVGPLLMNALGEAKLWESAVGLFEVLLRPSTAPNPNVVNLLMANVFENAGAQKATEVYQSICAPSEGRDDNWWEAVSPRSAGYAAVAYSHPAVAQWSRALRIAQDYLASSPERAYQLHQSDPLAHKLLFHAIRVSNRALHAEGLGVPEVPGSVGSALTHGTSVSEFFADARIPGVEQQMMESGAVDPSKPQSLVKPSSIRPGRQHYFRMSEHRRLKSYFGADYSTLDAKARQAKFTGPDPNEAPRAIPGGYEDMSSGWGHYGIFPKKIFYNARDVPNPLDGQIKRMPNFGDPNRSWRECSMHAQTRNTMRKITRFSLGKL